MTDEELERLAKGATEGEWRSETDGGMNPLMPWRIVRPFEPRRPTTARFPHHALFAKEADAKFAVAAQPRVILTLLERAREAEARTEELSSEIASMERSAELDDAFRDE